MGRLEFFTHRLYQRMQSDRFDASQWDSAVKAYALHVRALSRHAPGGVKVLARSSFHDCIMKRVSFDLNLHRAVLVLEGTWSVRAGRSWKGIRGMHRVEFSGVDRVGEMTSGMRHWLYGEVHGVGEFWEWRAMVAGNGAEVSTWTIGFDDVCVRSR